MKATPEMIAAGAAAARKYMEETGGNNPAVIWDAMWAAQPEQEPVALLANGARFKLTFDAKGRVSSLWHNMQELDGRWVALVAAEDDCHLKLTTPPQRKPLNDAIRAAKRTASLMHTEDGLEVVCVEPHLWRAVCEAAHGKGGA